MLSALKGSEPLEEFRQALYNLESSDILGCLESVARTGIVPSPDIEEHQQDPWGTLGYIEDWFLYRPTSKNIVKLSSLYSSSRPYTRRKTLGSYYKIGNRSLLEKGLDRNLPKRRRFAPGRPWNRYLVSYLKERSEARLKLGDSVTDPLPRYIPTDKDIENILSVVALYSDQLISNIDRQIVWKHTTSGVKRVSIDLQLNA
jgi:hypothetical protein